MTFLHFLTTFGPKFRSFWVFDPFWTSWGPILAFSTSFWPFSTQRIDFFGQRTPPRIRFWAILTGFWTILDPPRTPIRPPSDPCLDRSEPWSDPPLAHGFWVRKPYFLLVFSVKNGHFWGHFRIFRLLSPSQSPVSVQISERAKFGSF